MELFSEIMLRRDNTDGYTQTELDALNDELALRIRYLAESDIASAYEIGKAFADEVSHR
jgi:hypothetical protein